MDEDHSLPVPAESHGSGLTVESSQFAGFVVGKHLGRLVKEPLTGLAIALTKEAADMAQARLEGKALPGLKTALPGGSLVIDPDRDHVEGLKAKMGEGMRRSYGRLTNFLIKNGHCTPAEADLQFDRLAGEAVAAASDLLHGPLNNVNTLLIKRALSSARHHFSDLIGDGTPGDMGALGGKTAHYR